MAATKDYASETEAQWRRGSSGEGREWWLQLAWAMKKRATAMEGLDGNACGGRVYRVLVRPGAGERLLTEKKGCERRKKAY